MDPAKFCLDDYDCIGFDLDCTLAEYNIKDLMKMVYELLANYLIENKSYKSEFLLKPFEEGEYFLQKGLFMDIKKGNILKLSHIGTILKASHGTKPLSEENIVEQYGPTKTFNAFKEFINNPLSIINTPYEQVIRATLDCFDLPCILLFARAVDQQDKLKGSVSTEYTIWPDILQGLYQIYNRDYFLTGKSGFYSALKEQPTKYYRKWDPAKIEWLKEVKKKKFTFVLTGSFIDFAEWTATTCIDKNWKEYFDIVLCYARKPFFFFAGRPFLNVENGQETDSVEKNGLEINSVYTQGNWDELKDLISKQTNKKNPKCLYIGDNLIQDVFSPVHFKCCDSVAVAVELKDEFKFSKFWGSYFEDETPTYWNSLIRSHAKLCVSDLSVFSNRLLDARYNCLHLGSQNDISESNGYYVK